MASVLSRRSGVRYRVGSPLHDEITTIEYSIRAYQDGLEIVIGGSKGVPTWNRVRRRLLRMSSV